MVLKFSCPNCGADMSFDAKLGKLYCKHCEHSEEVHPDDEKYITDMYEDADKTVEYHCTNCGGILVTDEKTVATHCQYCDAPLILADRLSGKMRPKKVIPFKLGRDAAEAKFKKWCKNGRFTPKGFMTAKSIQNIKGMYVPYWVYDFDTNVKLDATGTRMRVWIAGDMEYTETSFYNVQRDIDLKYDNVPYDASREMDDDLMGKLEPFDFSEVTTFQMPYMAGYDGKQYDYSDEELKPHVTAKVSRYAEDYARGTIQGYSTVTVNSKNVTYRQAVSAYTMMPIWFFSYRFHDKDYYFAMNGQTGKVAGMPPISKGKVALWWSSISAGIFALLMLIGVLIR